MILRQPGGSLNSLGWLLLAVGILLSLEGLVWVVSPQILLRLLLRERAASVSSPLIRVFGATPLLFGVALVILVVVSTPGHKL
jgi:uncharacterized protein YjeT (DUF2065 family)